MKRGGIFNPSMRDNVRNLHAKQVAAMRCFSALKNKESTYARELFGLLGYYQEALVIALKWQGTPVPESGGYRLPPAPETAATLPGVHEL